MAYTIEGHEYPTILSAIREHRVFEVEKREDGMFCIGECCDKYFCVDLTPGQLRCLAQELINLSENIT